MAWEVFLVWGQFLAYLRQMTRDEEIAPWLRWLQLRGVSYLHGECKIWDGSLRMNTAVGWRADRSKMMQGSKMNQGMGVGLQSPVERGRAPRAQAWQPWMSDLGTNPAPAEDPSQAVSNAHMVATTSVTLIQGTWSPPLSSMGTPRPRHTHKHISKMLIHIKIIKSLKNSFHLYWDSLCLSQLLYLFFWK